MEWPVITVAWLSLPLLCWAVAARTKALGLAFGAMLAACAALTGMTAAGWLSSGWRFPPVALLTLAMVVILGAGIAAEGRQPGVPRLRRTTRAWAAAVPAGLFGVGCLAWVWLFACSGPPFVTLPSSATVLPLGAGLTAVRDTGSCDAGADNDFEYGCDRSIVVRGADGMPAKAVLALVLEDLAQEHGWDLPTSGDNAWGSCRYAGWQYVCVTVGTYPVPVGIDVSSP
jgi:hypothetical protein